MDVDKLQTYYHNLQSDTLRYFHQIPGSEIVVRYIKSSYQDDPVRSVFELLLALFAIRYLLARSYPADRTKGHVEFSEEVGQPQLLFSLHSAKAYVQTGCTQPRPPGAKGSLTPSRVGDRRPRRRLDT